MVKIKKANLKLLSVIEQYKVELLEIQQWFINNDWKINKIVVGEWETNDIRWIEYLNERKVKRERQDELNKLLTLQSKNV